jgi:hypothetical protein
MSDAVLPPQLHGNMWGNDIQSRHFITSGVPILIHILPWPFKSTLHCPCKLTFIRHFDLPTFTPLCPNLTQLLKFNFAISRINWSNYPRHPTVDTFMSEDFMSLTSSQSPPCGGIAMVKSYHGPQRWRDWLITMSYIKWNVTSSSHKTYSCQQWEKCY